MEMVQSKVNQPNWVQWLTLVLVVGMGLGAILFYPSTPEMPVIPEAAPVVVDMSGVESAIADINVKLAELETPADVSVDTTKFDRLCELTDGCEYYDISNSEAMPVRNIVEAKDDDFVTAFADLVGIDEDYLKISDITLKDTQVRAYTENDKDDENYNVELFYKVKYKDVDEKDYEYAYILVKSTLDEGDYDSLSLEEVSRTFEFD